MTNSNDEKEVTTTVEVELKGYSNPLTIKVDFPKDMSLTEQKEKIDKVVSEWNEVLQKREEEFELHVKKLESNT